MHPKLGQLAWFGVALLALAEVLSQAIDNLPLTLTLAILAFLLIAIAWVLNKMRFFCVNKSDRY